MELKETLSQVGFTKDFINHIVDYEEKLRSNGLEDSFYSGHGHEVNTVCYTESLMLTVENEQPVYAL